MSLFHYVPLISNFFQVEADHQPALTSRFQTAHKSVGSEPNRTSSDLSPAESDTNSFIDSINRQWYNSKRGIHIDPVIGFQRNKRYGKIYKSGDILDSAIAKRLSSQDRSSYSSSDYKMGSSTTSSMVCSSDESSIDFGIESRSVQSGDFDDVFPKEYRKERLSFNNAIDVNIMRHSSASCGSFATDKDLCTGDLCLEDFDTDTIDLQRESQLSSSDESDTGGETSKSRISAATLYEDAVSRVLENSRKSVECSKIGTEEIIMESVSDSSVSMRGVLFNVYAKDKLDGILVNTSSDNSGYKSSDYGINSDNQDSKMLPRSLKEKFDANFKLFQSNHSKISADSKSKSPTASSRKIDSEVISGVPLRMRLDRHISMDSSVSTISEAETVIYVPSTDLSRNNSSASNKQNDAIDNKTNVMSRSVSADGIIQNPNQLSTIKSETFKNTETSVSQRNSPKVSSRRGPDVTCVLNRKDPIHKISYNKSYENPSSDSMEEQELTMDLSDSQVSEKEDVSSNDESRRRRSRLGQVVKEAPIQVEILPYEERQKLSFREASSTASSPWKHFQSVSSKSQVTSSSSDDSGDGSSHSPDAGASCDVSSSMEVLHSSCEILDTPVRRRFPSTYVSSRPIEQLAISLSPIEITKEIFYRSSIASFDTEISDSYQLGFSETEDEIVNEETSDDDLELEEEEIKQWVEVRKSHSTTCIQKTLI